MTATDDLRRLLDKRGVEWDYGITGATTTRFSVNGIDLTFTPMRDGLVCSTILTPEQAIAATLGPVVRHPKPHEQWTTVLLPEIAWGLDDRWPDYLSVAHDAHGEWRVYVPEATPGRETCYPVPIYGFDGEFTEYDYDECSKCGAEWDGDTPNFCPWCGAKVVTE